MIGVEDVGYQEFQDALRSRIAERAYQVFEETGSGHEVADWIRAESEIVTRVPEFDESGSWVTVHLPLRDVPPSAIHVLLRGTEAIVCGQSGEPTGEPISVNAPHKPTYLSVKWRDPIDTSTASAYLKDGVVTITAKYASAVDRAGEQL